MQLAPLAAGGPSLNDGVGATPQPAAPATPAQALIAQTPVATPLTALQAAVAQAAASQGGLATLLSDLAAALQSPVVPTAVQAAGAQVLTYQLPIDPPPTAAELRQAVAQSGLFLESQLASGGSAIDLKSALLNLGQALETWSASSQADSAPAAVSTPAAQTSAAQTPAAQTYGAGVPQSPANPTPAPTAAIPAPINPTPSPSVAPASSSASASPVAAPSVVSPQATQTPSAPMIQAASATPAPPDPTGPALAPPIQTSAPAQISGASASVSLVQSVSLSPLLSSSPTPATLQAAVQSAIVAPGGLTVLTSELIAAQQSPTLPPAVRAAINAVLAAAPSLSAPAVTASLAQTAASSDAPLPSPPPVFQPPGLQAAGESSADELKAALATLGQALEAWSAPTDAASPAPPPNRGPSPAPPYRGGPLQGQAAPPGGLLSPGASPELIAAHLLKATGGALSRQVLMQAASSPVETATSGKSAAPHWMFEIPLATPQGASVVPFEIEGDDASGADAAERTWRTRFSLDVHPMGPVHAKLTLRGGTVRVALWAEDADTQSLLSDQRSDLADALHDAGLDALIAVLSGAPETAAPPSAGRFMDRAV